MARPTKSAAESRTEPVRYRLTKAEWRQAELKARAAGMSVPLYLRRAGLAARVVVRQVPVTADARLVAELNRIGVNLNQMVRAYHAAGTVPTELRATCKRIEELVVQAAGGE